MSTVAQQDMPTLRLLAVLEIMDVTGVVEGDGGAVCDPTAMTNMFSIENDRIVLLESEF